MSRKQNNGFGRGGWKALGLVLLAVATGGLLSWMSRNSGDTRSGYTNAAFATSTADGHGSWTVGQLREDGLRIIPSGRADAADVLDPDQFTDLAVQRAYWIATQIPETLNHLYCWCGCENRGVHRSNLGCFEDRMGVDCEVCRGTAEIAYEMVQKGATDTGRIQAAVDVRWAPPGA